MKVAACPTKAGLSDILISPDNRVLYQNVTFKKMPLQLHKRGHSTGKNKKLCTAPSIPGDRLTIKLNLLLMLEICKKKVLPLIQVPICLEPEITVTRHI